MDFKPQDQVVYRRRANRSGPPTTELLLGSVLSVDEQTKTASVQVMRGNAMAGRIQVPTSELQPVSSVYPHRRINFNPIHRGF